MTTNMIIRNSMSKIYDEAKAEWELKAIVSEESEGFSNVCQLCGNPHLKINFIISNPLTGHDLIVGSRCIVRFGIIKGNVDAESGSLIINNFIKEQESIFHVRTLVKGMMVLRPDAKDYKLFYEALKHSLDHRNIKDPTIETLGEICYGEKWKSKCNDIYIRERLKLLWYRPLLIETVKTKASKLPVYKEGTTWGHKSRKSQVYNNMAGRSESFKTDIIGDK